jgi:hypothetical protein
MIRELKADVILPLLGEFRFAVGALRLTKLKALVAPALI